MLDREDEEGNVVPGEWRNNIQLADIDNVRGGNIATHAGKKQRELLKLYYNSVGAVPWQMDRV